VQIETESADFASVSLPAEQKKMRVDLHNHNTFTLRGGMTQRVARRNVQNGTGIFAKQVNKKKNVYLAIQYYGVVTNVLV
jgi:hypothetical protein